MRRLGAQVVPEEDVWPHDEDPATCWTCWCRPTVLVMEEVDPACYTVIHLGRDDRPTPSSAEPPQ